MPICEPESARLALEGHLATARDRMEKERGLDRSAAIADMRFTFIEKICESTVIKPTKR